MAYPDEIVADLTNRYQLDQTQQSMLRNSLLVDELKGLIETQAFNPDNLLIEVPYLDGANYLSVLSPIAVQAIIANYHAPHISPHFLNNS